MRTLTSVLAFVAITFVARGATNQYAVLGPDFTQYLLNGVSNPDLKLVRGFVYTFNVNASGHPFWINSVQSTGTGNPWNIGVTNNGTQSGTVTFAVPNNAPDTLYYNCQFHALMTGILHIEDPPQIAITEFTLASTLVIRSLGTDALNFYVRSSPDLVSGIWTNANVIGNSFANGTNATEIGIPAGDVVFFQVLQTLP